MSKKSTATHLAVASFMLAAVASCSRGQSSTGGGGENVEWALESFDVPAGHRQQVGEMLKGLLQPQKARVDISPDGRLLVMAPRGMHKQIRAALTPLMNKPIPGASRLKLTYWMVKAQPRGEGAVPPGPVLQEIAPALAEVEKAMGPVQMTLLERIVMRSTSGEATSTEARNFTIKHEVSTVEGRAVGRVEITTAVVHDSGSPFGMVERKTVLDTRISLLPGQLAVIAETGIAGRLRGQAKTTTPEGEWTLLIAVKATVDDAADRP